MKNFEDYYQETLAAKLKEAAGIDPTYGEALLSEFPEEQHERIASWAMKYFADRVFSAAINATRDAAAKDIDAENPDLNGAAFMDAVWRRVEQHMPNAEESVRDSAKT